MAAFLLRVRFLRRLGSRAMSMVAPLVSLPPQPATSLAALMSRPSAKSESEDECDGGIDSDFSLLEAQGCEMSKRACLAILKDANAVSDIRRVHTHLVCTNRQTDAAMCKSLIEGYGRCGSVTESIRVFNSLRRHNPEMWSTLLRAHLDCNKHAAALAVVRKMFHEGAPFRREVYVYAIEAARVLKRVDVGQLMHGCTVESGDASRPVVCRYLISMYGDLGMLREARRVFDSMPRDAACYSAMISVYSQQGVPQLVLRLFWKMTLSWLPDEDTCLAAVEASSAALDAQRVHARIALTGMALHESVQEALLCKFLELPSLEDARMVLDEMNAQGVASWRHWEALLTAYQEHGYPKRVVGLCRLMNLEGWAFQEDPTLVQAFRSCQDEIARPQPALQE